MITASRFIDFKNFGIVYDLEMWTIGFEFLYEDLFTKKTLIVIIHLLPIKIVLGKVRDY